MSPWLIGFLAAVGGYLLGSINFALIFARVKGADLRGQGSGNPGATNAGRIMGRSTGVIVALLDITKGYVPAALAAALAGDEFGMIAGVAAILGHITSPFAGFRGGKGVATAGGVVLALRPLWAIPVLVAFTLVFLLTRRMGIASVAGALTLVPTALVLGQRPYDAALATAIAVVVTVRHYRNIREALTPTSRRPG